MTWDVALLFCAVALLIFLVFLIMIRLDSKAHKNYIELKRAQTEQWQITDQFHKAMLQMFQEAAHHQAEMTADAVNAANAAVNAANAANQQPVNGSKTYTVWH